jgi:hypothetical protein
MTLSKTSPQELAAHIIASIGVDVDYASISVDGARKAARLIIERLGCDGP